MFVGKRARSLLDQFEVPADSPRGVRWRRWFGEEVGVAAGAVAATLAIVAIVMHAWNWSLTMPQHYGSDTLYNATLIKGILHNGWYLTNPSLGAPFGQELYDFPIGGDNLHLLLIKGLGLFSSNAFVVMNLFFIATFVLVTLTAYTVLRCLRVSRLVSAGVSVLYAILPYHFYHGELHLFLSGYYAVPLAVLLVVWALGDAPLFWRTDTKRWPPRFHLDRRSVAALACCVVLGSTDSYYAIFAVIILVICGSIVAIGRGGWASLATSALLAAAVLAVLAINLAPSIIYRQVHGVDAIVALRSPMESEHYGLKFARLFLPTIGHRIGPLANLTARYEAFPMPGEPAESLGFAFSIGLIYVLARGLTGGLRLRHPATRQDHTVSSLALAAVVAILVGVMTGLSVVIALLITPQFRGWSRISVVIAFCAAGGLALLLDRMLGRLRSSRMRLGLAAPVMVALVIVASLDQTTTLDVPNYSYVRTHMTIDSEFMRAVQHRLPVGAMVFQLPYMTFPGSSPIFQLQDYELIKGYLLSDGLKWSYGAMEGRAADWQPALLRYPLPVVMRAVAVAGFQGLYIDRRGYSDAGASLDAVLASVVGPPVLQSSDHSLELYDLRPLAAQLHQRFAPAQLTAMADAALHQVSLQYGSGFYPPEAGGSNVSRWASARAQLVVSNLDSSPRTLRLRGSLVSPGPELSTTTIRGPGLDVSLRTSASPTPLSVDTLIPPGTSVITFSTASGRQPADLRNVHLQLLNPQFVDPQLTPLEG